MGTHCLIGKYQEDRTIRYIYCHYDGGLDHAGKILVDNYDNSNIDKLLDLGDLSSLGPTPVSDPEAWKSSQNRDYNLCVAYKDRGEDCPAQVDTGLGNYYDNVKYVSVVYLLKDNVWYYTDGTSGQFQILVYKLL